MKKLIIWLILGRYEMQHMQIKFKVQSRRNVDKYLHFIVFVHPWRIVIFVLSMDFFFRFSFAAVFACFMNITIFSQKKDRVRKNGSAEFKKCYEKTSFRKNSKFVFIQISSYMEFRPLSCHLPLLIKFHAKIVAATQQTPFSLKKSSNWISPV